MREFSSFLFVVLIGIIAVLAACGETSASKPEFIPSPACGPEEWEECLAGKGKEWALELGQQPRENYLGVIQGMCAASDPEACGHLGALLRSDRYNVRSSVGMSDTFADDQLATDAFRKSCDLGSMIGCMSLGSLLEKNLQKDFEDARPEDQQPILEAQYQACEKGFEPACLVYLEFSTSVSLEKGKGGLKNYISRELFAGEVACRDNDDWACLAHGITIAQTSDNKSEFEKALPFWRKACRLGNQDGCQFYGGNRLHDGDQIEADWAMKTACEFGFDPTRWDDGPDYPACPN